MISDKKDSLLNSTNYDSLFDSELKQSTLSYDPIPDHEYLDNKLSQKKQELSKLDIFYTLCPEEKYKQFGYCSNCKKDLMTKKKRCYCKFCGKECCEDCLKNSRPDPKQLDTNHKICEYCSKSYLERAWMKPYWHKFESTKRFFKEAEINHKCVQEELHNLESYISIKTRELENGVSHHKTQLENKEYQVEQLKTKIDSIKEETKVIQARDEELNRKQEEAEKIRNDKYQLLEEKKENQLDLDRQHNAIDQEIEFYKRQIESKNMGFSQMRGTIQATNRPTMQKVSIFSDGYNNSYLRQRGVPTQGPDNRRNSQIKKSNPYCLLI